MSRSRKDVLDAESMLTRLTNVLVAAAPDGWMEARADAESLRRISMTLHRWHELECGVDAGGIDRDAGGIDRDETTGKCWWYSSHLGKRTYVVPDREKGALARLAKVMARYPSLQAYVQGDPRGCALYILRKSDIPPGGTVDEYHHRGVAVQQ